MYTIRQAQHRLNMLSLRAFRDYDLWIYGFRPKTRPPAFLSTLLFQEEECIQIQWGLHRYGFCVIYSGEAS